MNEISKARIELAKKYFVKFRSNGLVAAIVTGSVAKGYADDNSDVDTIMIYDRALTKEEFDEIIDGAKQSGGDFYHGTPEEGFAVYYYFEGVRCDFGFGQFAETEKLFNEVTADDDSDIDVMKHLQVSGIIDGVVLHGENLIKPLVQKAAEFPKSLQVKLVKMHLRFHPKWALEKMAVGRGDVLYYYESLLECTGNMIGILCGLNKAYHAGKLKGVEYTLKNFNIMPENFIERYKAVFKLSAQPAIDELYILINETCDLIDKHLPEVSTLRSREIQKLVLRK